MDSNLIFTQPLLIDSSHADRFGCLRPSALLEFMQEAAGIHATYLGLGRKPLLERNLFWAVVRQTLEINRLPSVGETMILETWPAPPTRTAFPRHMLGRTEDGEILFRAVTLWLFMDMETRAMVLPGACGMEVPGTVRGIELPLPGGIPPKVYPNREDRRVRYTDLDYNGHMSNTKYLNWMDDLLPASFHRDHKLKSLRICYLNEAREDQTLALSWSLEEGSLSLEGRLAGEDGHRVFAVKAQF